MALLEREAEESMSTVETESNALQSCLEKLPRAQRELVEIIYTKGERIDRLALDMGKTPMSVYKTLHRIRMMLADCIRKTLAKQEGIA